MGMEGLSRSETAKRGETEGIEERRKAHLNEIAKEYKMSVSDLNSLQMSLTGKNKPPVDQFLHIKGTVNGVSVEVEEHLGRTEAKLDGQFLSQSDSKEIYNHLRNAAEERDDVNNQHIEWADDELRMTHEYEQEVAAVRDKFWGGKTPEHGGFSKSSEERDTGEK